MEGIKKAKAEQKFKEKLDVRQKLIEKQCMELQQIKDKENERLTRLHGRRKDGHGLSIVNYVTGTRAQAHAEVVEPITAPTLHKLDSGFGIVRQSQSEGSE